MTAPKYDPKEVARLLALRDDRRQRNVSSDSDLESAFDQLAAAQERIKQLEECFRLIVRLWN